MFNLSVNILQLTIQITTCVFFWSQLAQRRFAFLWTILFATVPATTIMLMTMHSDWSYSFISILKLASCVLLYWLLFRGGILAESQNIAADCNDFRLLHNSRRAALCAHLWHASGRPESHVRCTDRRYDSSTGCIIHCRSLYRNHHSTKKFFYQGAG